MRRQLPHLVALATVLLAAGVAPAITIDGGEGGEYPGAIVTQAVQTQFGDNNLGLPDWANGSELDVAYGVISGGSLFLLLGGSLESNFNKLDIFIDSQPGGQNKLRGDNPNVDFDGLNRMGDDGSGNGLTFDAGFESDYYLTVTGGDIGGGVYALFANFAETPTGGGGVGNYLGQGGAQTDGTLSGGTNPDGIRITIDNSDAGGVPFGCDPASGAGVATGIEIEIPLSAIGNPGGCVDVVAFINGGGHDFLSNQVLGPLSPTQCNLGEPRGVDFNQYPGTQHFRVCEGPVSLDRASWGRTKARYR